MLMKKIIITLILILCVCSCTRPIEEELCDIERLMNERPDSALYLIEHIDKRRLKKEEDRGWYSLLYVQAQDKNFIEYSDSVAKKAVDYYKLRNDDTRKAYAYYYYANACLNRNDLDRAMEHLTYANIASSCSSDSKLKGLISHSLARCYFAQLDIQSALDLYNKSASHFLEIEDSENALIALSDVVNCMLILDMNSEVLLYIRKVKELAKQLDYQKGYIGALAIQKYLGVDVSHETDDSLDMLLMQSSDAAKYYSVLGGIYYDNNQLDSARLYLQRAYDMIVSFDVDNYGLLPFLAEIEEKSGNYRDALFYQRQYSNVADSLFAIYENKSVQELEYKYRAKYLQSTYDMLEIRHRYTYLVFTLFILVIVSIVILIVILYIKRTRQKNQEIIEYKSYIEEGKAQYKLLNDKYVELLDDSNAHNMYMDKLREILKNRIQSLRILSDYAYKYELKPEKFYVRFKEHMKLSQTCNQEFARDVMAMADIYCNGIISYLINRYPDLTRYELTYCSFICLGFTPESIRILLNHTNVYSIYTLRTKIRSKMNLSSDIGTLEKYIIDIMEKRSEIK